MRNQTGIVGVGQKKKEEVEIIARVIKLMKAEAESIARKINIEIQVTVSRKEGAENIVQEVDHERSKEADGMIVQVVMIIRNVMTMTKNIKKKVKRAKSTDHDHRLFLSIILFNLIIKKTLIFHYILCVYFSHQSNLYVFFIGLLIRTAKQLN